MMYDVPHIPAHVVAAYDDSLLHRALILNYRYLLGALEVKDKKLIE